jgi:hypothetical protein
MVVLNGATKLRVATALTLGAACGSGHFATSGGDTVSGAGGMTHGGTSGTSTRATSAVVSTGALGAGGGGGSAPACNPPAAVGSFWAQDAQQYGVLGPVSMCDYRGDVLLVVNTADV